MKCVYKSCSIHSHVMYKTYFEMNAEFTISLKYD